MHAWRVCAAQIVLNANAAGQASAAAGRHLLQQATPAPVDLSKVCARPTDAPTTPLLHKITLLLAHGCRLYQHGLCCKIMLTVGIHEGFLHPSRVCFGTS